MWPKRNAYEMVDKQERKKPFGRCRCRWEVGIKMILREI
jgi:hypothetical protein